MFHQALLFGLLTVLVCCLAQQQHLRTKDVPPKRSPEPTAAPSLDSNMTSTSSVNRIVNLKVKPSDNKGGKPRAKQSAAISGSLPAVDGTATIAPTGQPTGQPTKIPKIKKAKTKASGAVTGSLRGSSKVVKSPPLLSRLLAPAPTYPGTTGQGSEMQDGLDLCTYIFKQKHTCTTCLSSWDCVTTNPKPCQNKWVGVTCSGGSSPRVQTLSLAPLYKSSSCKAKTLQDLFSCNF